MREETSSNITQQKINNKKKKNIAKHEIGWKFVCVCVPSARCDSAQQRVRCHLRKGRLKKKEVLVVLITH